MNRFGPEVNAPFFNEQGVRLEGPSYLAQLYFWKADGVFRPAAGNPVPFSTNGWFFGESVLLPFVPECGSAWVQVRAWEAQGGETFELAALAGAWTGVSSILFLQPLGSPSRPEACIHARLIGLQYPGSPLVVRQPESLTVLTGEPAAVSVIASSGVHMAYQWYQQPSERPDGLILGATNATYTTPPLTNNATYWVSVTNSAGSVLSDKAIVTVVPDPPRLTLEQMIGQPLLTLDGLPGIIYRIEYSTNLSTSNWTSLVELLLNTTPFTISDPGGSNLAARFYRAVAP